MLLKDFLWKTYVPARLNLSDRAAKQIGYAISSFGKSLGRAAKIEDLTEGNVNNWTRQRLESNSRVTVSRQRSSLLTIWRFAARKKLVGPPPDFESIRLPRKIPRAWTLTEVESILRRCRKLPGRIPHTDIRASDWWTSLHLFLYDTGTRLSATLSIRSTDMAVFQNCCLLRADDAKTWLEQVVHFSSQTAEAISKIVDLSREHVWPWSLCRRTLFSHYKRILEDANVDAGKYVGFHRMRRTNATQLVAAAGWEAASRGLGHTSVNMTKKYVDLRQLEHGKVDLPRPHL